MAKRIDLWVISTSTIDELLKAGGTGELAERIGLGNLFLGPKRFGTMFPDATPFRPDDEALIDLGYPRGVHLPRRVRRPRHHLRPDQGLPAGDGHAHADAAELASGPEGPVVAAHKFDQQTPLFGTTVSKRPRSRPAGSTLVPWGAVSRRR